MKAALAGGVVLVAIVAAVFWNRSSADPLTAVVTRGSLVATLTEAGTLRPAEVVTYRLRVPGKELEILWLAAEGSSIKKGDPLIKFDTTELEADLQRARQAQRQAQLEVQVAEGESKAATAAVAGFSSGKDRLEEEEARLAVRMAELKAQRLKKDYDTLAPLVEKGYVTRDELERAGLDVEQAEGALVIARKRLALISDQTVPQQQQRATVELAQREGQMAVARQRLADSTAQVDQFTAAIADCNVRAAGDGLVVYEDNMSTAPRRKIRVGDRVTSSQGVLTIPGVSSMLAETSIREADLHRLKAGQRAVVTLEAYPSLRLQGTVLSIGTIARARAERPFDGKRFDVIVALDSVRSDLRPEMSARVEIQVGQTADALIVPTTAVFSREGERVVHVVSGRNTETRVVTVGQSDDMNVQILSGVREGERVRLIDAPTAGSSPPATPLP